MWRVALRYRPGSHPPNVQHFMPQWQVVQCWSCRGQRAYDPVKVERKNAARKRLILLSPLPLQKNIWINPMLILCEFLSSIPDAEKLRLVREGLA